jgi:hypothetical protein
MSAPNVGYVLSEVTAQGVAWFEDFRGAEPAGRRERPRGMNRGGRRSVPLLLAGVGLAAERMERPVTQVASRQGEIDRALAALASSKPWRRQPDRRGKLPSVGRPRRRDPEQVYAVRQPRERTSYGCSLSRSRGSGGFGGGARVADGVPLPEPLRHIPPRSPRAVLPRHRLDRETVIRPRPRPPRRRRHQRLHHSPNLVRDLLPRHRSRPGPIRGNHG